MVPVGLMPPDSVAVSFSRTDTVPEDGSVVVVMPGFTFVWLVYVQSTLPPGPIVMETVWPLITTLVPNPVTVPQTRLTKVQPAGGADSVTVSLPAGTSLNAFVPPPARLKPAVPMDPVVEYANVEFPFWVTLWIVMVPQLLMFTGTGATKSLTSAVNEADERLFRNALPNALQTPGGNTPAPVRLMAVSPKVFAANVRGAFGAIGSITLPGLMAPSELAELRLMLFPQQGSELLAKHWLVEPVVTPKHNPI